MSKNALDNHYVNAKLAALYDTNCGWGEDRDFYLSQANQPGMDILDIGCGTGLLCHAYAKLGHKVVGVDPAQAMLDVARQQQGSGIEWVQAYAQDISLSQKFDLIIMTGHAFQVLLSDADVLKLFAVVAEHLKPDGRFVFESRNPLLNWVEKWDGRVETWQSDAGKFQAEITVFGMKDEIIEFEQRYVFQDETLISKSVLRFYSLCRIESLLIEAGLQVRDLYGDWSEGAFDVGSEEMVFSVSG